MRGHDNYRRVTIRHTMIFNTYNNVKLILQLIALNNILVKNSLKLIKTRIFYCAMAQFVMNLPCDQIHLYNMGNSLYLS